VSGTSKKRAAIASLIAVTALALLAEVLWRVDHSPSSGVSNHGLLASESRHLPERGPLPYGQGVYVFPRFVPVRSMFSKLVFVGYCGNLHLQWHEPKRLHVQCLSAEGAPKQLASSSMGAALTSEIALRAAN
jgi:hypothetical protein